MYTVEKQKNVERINVPIYCLTVKRVHIVYRWFIYLVEKKLTFSLKVLNIPICFFIIFINVQCFLDHKLHFKWLSKKIVLGGGLEPFGSPDTVDCRGGASQGSVSCIPSRRPTRLSRSSGPCPHVPKGQQPGIRPLICCWWKARCLWQAVGEYNKNIWHLTNI